jgi:hypothetical protein
VTAACPRASRAVSRTACSALAAASLAGCGGTSAPKLAHADAAPLIAFSHRVAHEGTCGQARDIPRLQQRVIVLINTGRVPAKLQEPFSGAANALAEARPRCTPMLGPAPNPSRRARTLEEWLRENSG